jgi:hypothetical protein
MNHLFIALLIATGISGVSFGQNIPSGLGNVNLRDAQKKPPSDQLPTAQKLTSQQMTNGLTNENASGVPGLNFQGGVAGYVGPPRPSDMASPTAIYPAPGSDMQADQYEAIQEAERRAEEMRLRALQQQQRAVQAQRARPRAQVQDTSRLNAHDLARYCESKGLGVNHNTNSCISMGGLSRGGGSVATWEREPDQPYQNRVQSRFQRIPQDRDMYGGRNQAGSLITACKGLGVNFVTGNCVSNGGEEVNPRNLWPPFAAPLPKPESGELIMRCGALGKTADFVTGRCM